MWWIVFPLDTSVSVTCVAVCFLCRAEEAGGDGSVPGPRLLCPVGSCVRVALLRCVPDGSRLYPVQWQWFTGNLLPTIIKSLFGVEPFVSLCRTCWKWFTDPRSWILTHYPCVFLGISLHWEWVKNSRTWSHPPLNLCASDAVATASFRWAGATTATSCVSVRRDCHF